MSDRAGGDNTQPPLSENDEHASDESALSASTATLLRPARRRAVVVPAIVFGFTASLVGIGISRLEPPVERPKPQPQIDAADTPQPKRPDRFFEQPVEPIEPLKSLVWDTAQSYFATGSLPVATTPPAKSGNPPKTQ
jgi:hypothetical protein